MLKLMSNSLRKNRVLVECPINISPKQFIIYKVRNSNFIVEKPGTYHVNQRIKVNITSNKTW